MKNPGSRTHDAGGSRLKTGQAELTTGNPHGLITSMRLCHGTEKIADSVAIEHPVI
jgi:hypothetical protein